VTLASQTGGKVEEVVSAKYVIGADGTFFTRLYTLLGTDNHYLAGARSWVRDTIQIPMIGENTGTIFI
jgi:hypothetical protein